MLQNFPEIGVGDADSRTKPIRLFLHTRMVAVSWHLKESLNTVASTVEGNSARIELCLINTVAANTEL
jgi:hypothetical protein